MDDLLSPHKEVVKNFPAETNLLDDISVLKNQNIIYS